MEEKRIVMLKWRTPVRLLYRIDHIDRKKLLWNGHIRRMEYEILPRKICQKNFQNYEKEPMPKCRILLRML